MKLRTFGTAAFVLTLMIGVVSAQDATPESTGVMMDGDLPDQVVIEREGLFPEGVEWNDAAGVWLVSSTSEGTVYAVNDDGLLTPFIQDERIPASLGLEVDEAQNRLLVAATNQEDEGYLGIYDLTTGETLAWVDFAPLLPTDPEHFVNDVAVDADGNAYVTDSLAGVIYRVDPAGNAVVFLSDERFSTNFALNGIDYHAPTNSLIAVLVPGLIQIPLDDPLNFTSIDVGIPLPGADGVTLLDDQTLVVVNNNPPMVYRIEGGAGWASARVTGEFDPGDVFPTTAAIRAGEAYVLHAQLDRQGSTTETFPIQRVIFADMMTAEPTAQG